MRSLPLLIAATLAVAVAPVAAAIVRRPPPAVFHHGVGRGERAARDAARTLETARRRLRRRTCGRSDRRGQRPEDPARCRAEHAAFAVAATFKRIPDLPALGEEPRRIYAIARFTVRDCTTGALGRTHAVLLHSDPPENGLIGFEAAAERMWLRAAHTELARVPLSLVVQNPSPAPSEEPAPSDRPVPRRALPLRYARNTCSVTSEFSGRRRSAARSSPPGIRRSGRSG